MIAQAEKLNTKPLKNVIESLKSARNTALKTQELIRLRSDSLEMALGKSGSGASRMALTPCGAAYATLITFWIILGSFASQKFSFSP